MEKQKRKNEANSPLFLRLLGALFGGIWHGLGALFKGLWWGLGKVAKGAWWTVKLPYRLLRYLISGRVPQFENSRQEEIFWRIKRQYRRKRLFVFHAMLYVIAFVTILGVNISEYIRLLPFIDNPDWAYSWQYFQQTLVANAFGLGVWTLILLFHFVFNRMGNEEDVALGKALQQEYARSEYQEETYQRLREPIIEDDEDYESKPKRNGAKS